ncbi:MAG: hypothetical protein AAGB25_07710 [Pseudomonadota bacterium]
MRQIRARATAVILAASVWAAPALSETPYEYFSVGAYEDAAGAADALETADGHAFAARALLAEYATADEPASGELLRRAQASAEAALALEPDHAEGLMQLAISLSMQARPMSVREAMASGNGERARELAEMVLDADPNNYYAHGFLAVWHVEVRRRGGALGASVMGASVKKGRAHYERCAYLAPDNASLHWQYGRALIAHNPEKFGAEALEALDRALAANTDDHLEATSQARAALIADLLASDVRSASERAAEML